MVFIRIKYKNKKPRFGLEVRGAVQLTFKNYARLFINTCVGVGSDANRSLDAVSLANEFNTFCFL